MVTVKYVKIIVTVILTEQKCKIDVAISASGDLNIHQSHSKGWICTIQVFFVFPL